MSRLHRIVMPTVLAATATVLLGLGASPALAHPSDAHVPVSTSATAIPSATSVHTTPAATRTARFTPLLTGAQEVGVVASPRGSVSVRFALNPRTGSVTFRKLVPTLLFEREDEFGPIKFHIHRGVAGQNGPVVIDLTAVADQGQTRGRVKADPALVAEIAAHPENFYVNYHTISHPDGAVRGQLG